MIRSRLKSILGAILSPVVFLALYTSCVFAQRVETEPVAGDATVTEEKAVSPNDLGPWAPLAFYGNGYHSSVAMNATGLIVEVHQGGDSAATNFALWYRLGQLDPARGTVTWSTSHKFHDRGDFFPSVAITKEGYVIIVYNSVSSDLSYYVGTVNPSGGINQDIQFKVRSTHYDQGSGATLSVNNNGVIAEAHTGAGSSNQVFYRLGHLNAPGSGDFTIFWDTGSNGRPYAAEAKSPVISINDNGDVVEVHRARKGETCWYVRGKLSGNSIAFSTEHWKYAENAVGPTIVLQNNGNVMEMRIDLYKDWLGAVTQYNLKYHQGYLDDNPNVIRFLTRDYFLQRTPRRPGLATNGTYAIATPGYASGDINYTWAIAP